MGKSLKGKDLGKGIDQLKDGRYRARYLNEYGKRVAIYDKNLTRLKRNLKDKQKKTLVVKEINGGRTLADDITLNELYERWRDVELYPGDKKANTKLCYTAAYEYHLRHYLGKMKVKKINYDILLQFYNDIKLHCGVSTINNCYKVLKCVFKYALQNNIISGMPYMKFPPLDKNEKIVYLTEKEQDIFLEYSAKYNKHFSCVLTIALHTGMRVGEIIGIRKQDVDLDNNIILVSQQMQRVGINKIDLINEEDIICVDSKTVFYIIRPKTNNSSRIVPIDEECKKALIWLKENRDTCIKNMPTDFIIKNKKMFDELFILYNKRPLKGTTLNSHINNVVKNIKKDNQAFSVDELSMHKLRHTFATRCLDKGISTRVIQSILGHKNDKITEIYAHVTDVKIFEEFKKFNN